MVVNSKDRINLKEEDGVLTSLTFEWSKEGAAKYK